MGRVRLEVLPWATRAFDSSASSRLVMEEEIKEGDRVEDLFTRLARRYQGFGQMAFDPAAQRLTGQITVIYNGCVLELAGGLETKLRDGDHIVLLPAFAGGDQWSGREDLMRRQQTRATSLLLVLFRSRAAGAFLSLSLVPTGRPAKRNLDRAGQNRERRGRMDFCWLPYATFALAWGHHSCPVKVGRIMHPYFDR